MYVTIHIYVYISVCVYSCVYACMYVSIYTCGSVHNTCIHKAFTINTNQGVEKN